MSNKVSRGSRGRVGRGARGGRGSSGGRESKLAYSRFDQNFEDELEYEDDAISGQENLEFLALVNGAEIPKVTQTAQKLNTKASCSYPLRSAAKRHYDADLDLEFEDEGDDNWEYEAEVKPTRAYNTKKLTADEICNQYISAFKKNNDLKLNDYFKVLNKTVINSFTLLTKEVATLNSYFRNNSWSGQDKGVREQRKRVKLTEKVEDCIDIEICSSQEQNDSKLSPPHASFAAAPVTVQEVPEKKLPRKSSLFVETKLKSEQNSLSKVESNLKCEPSQSHTNDFLKGEISLSEFNKIVNGSRNHTSCATSLTKAMFTRSELTNDEFNVTGNSVNGHKRYKLDPERILIIQGAAIDRKPIGVTEEEAWQDCCTAIHKLQYELRVERRAFTLLDD